MKEPTYRQTLAHAWNVVWENKILWILGLLSVFLGQLGFSDIFGKIWSMFDGSLAREGVALAPLLKLNFNGELWSALGLVWLSIICVAVFFLVMFLATASQGALISYAADWFKNGKHQPITKPWHKSVKHFWSILLVNVVRQALLFLLLLGFVLIAENFFVSRTPLEGFIFATSAVLILVASLVFSALCVYTLCYVVIDGKGVVESVKKAWALFSDHLLVSLEVGLLLMLLNFLLVLVIAVGSFFAFLPSVLIWVAAGFTNLVVLAAVGFMLGIFLLLLFIALVAGFFNAYTISAWVFLFMRMHKEGVSSRTIHFFKHMFSK